ncbi:MAG: efflux RND transporter periplasmic adaptor subunit [Alphaproteobacteria bacterium]
MSEKILGFIQFVLVFVFIAGSVMISFALKPQKEQVQSRDTQERTLIVETTTLAPQDYRIVFEATGNVGVRSEIGIVPQVSGRIVSVNDNFFAGGAFEADETLFQIDLRDFELEVERLEAEVARARTAFNLEQAESKAAIEEWESLNPGQKPPPLVARKPQMDEAWANLKAAKAQLANAQLDLERASYSYPFKGRVLSSALEQGQYVTAGQNYGSVFDLNSLEVRASLRDMELEWLLDSEDPDITILIEKNNQTRTYKGQLNRAAAALNELTRFATVSFGFADEMVDILPGAFARISIQSREMKNIVVLPASAMQKEGIIWVLEEDGTLKRMVPEVIYANDEAFIVRVFDEPKEVVTSRVSGAMDRMKAKRVSQQTPQSPALETLQSDQGNG